MELAKGAFNNYVEKILALFDPPPCADSFYIVSVDKNRHFLTPSPPHLVHVVIEWPQRLKNVKNMVQLNAFKKVHMRNENI